MSKIEEKQFPLTNIENCCIYLCKIISSSELCMDKLKKYNQESYKILEQYKGKKVIPYDKYGEMCDKTYNVIGYLLNLLGDAQSSSVSYFKYRNYMEKRFKKGNTDIPLFNMDDNVKELLLDFNRNRNWQNHVPESLLIAEMEMVKAGKITFPTDPVEISHYISVEYEYYEHLYLSNLFLYNNARTIIQTAKKEYSLLMGKRIEYPRVYLDKPLGIDKSEPTKKSARVQGIKEESY